MVLSVARAKFTASNAPTDRPAQVDRYPMPVNGLCGANQYRTRMSARPLCMCPPIIRRYYMRVNSNGITLYNNHTYTHARVYTHTCIWLHLLHVCIITALYSQIYYLIYTKNMFEFGRHPWDSCCDVIANLTKNKQIPTNHVRAREQIPTNHVRARGGSRRLTRALHAGLLLYICSDDDS
jgi:hypothetical protein